MSARSVSFLTENFQLTKRSVRRVTASRNQTENNVNTNLIHNILNFLLALVGGLMAFDFSSVVSASTAGTIIAVLSGAKLLMNAIRDGLAGMAKAQPPVQ